MGVQNSTGFATAHDQNVSTGCCVTPEDFTVQTRYSRVTWSCLIPRTAWH